MAFDYEHSLQLSVKSRCKLDMQFTGIQGCGVFVDQLRAQEPRNDCEPYY